jgi:hypothetical protein
MNGRNIENAVTLVRPYVEAEETVTPGKPDIHPMRNHPATVIFGCLLWKMSKPAYFYWRGLSGTPSSGGSAPWPECGYRDGIHCCDKPIWHSGEHVDWDMTMKDAALSKKGLL